MYLQIRLPINLLVSRYSTKHFTLSNLASDNKFVHIYRIENSEMVKCDVVCETKGSNDDPSKFPANSLSVIGKLSFVDRFLSLWIISVMVIGVVVGFYSPETQSGLARIEGNLMQPDTN